MRCRHAVNAKHVSCVERKRPFRGCKSDGLRCCKLIKTSKTCYRLANAVSQVGSGQKKITSNRSGDADRLFSTVDLSNNRVQHSPGSVFGASALVAGTTVGAGILAVPFVTEESGFIAASGALIGMWAYSVVCGLLIAEVNLNTLCQLGRTGATITTMAERTLGVNGSKAVATTFIFLHCAMLVAYIARAGEIVSDAGIVSSQLACIGFSGGLGVACYGLKPNAMDTINSALVGGVVVTFLGLLVTAAPGVDPHALLKANVAAIPKTLPVLSIAFIYHSIIPVVTTTLEGDVRKIRTAIVTGTGVPLLMFLAWDAAILGSLGPSRGASGADPLKALAETEPIVGPLIQIFSFLAVTTSFIGFLLGIADFLADLLDVPPGKKSALPFVLSVAPPTIFAISYPDVFFKALDYAGTYGVILLFGLVPAVMAWRERYNDTTLSRVRVVPGGKGSLIVLGGIAAAIIGNQAYGSILGLLQQ